MILVPAKPKTNFITTTSSLRGAPGRAVRTAAVQRVLQRRLKDRLHKGTPTVVYIKL